MILQNITSKTHCKSLIPQTILKDYFNNPLNSSFTKLQADYPGTKMVELLFLWLLLPEALLCPAPHILLWIEVRRICGPPGQEFEVLHLHCRLGFRCPQHCRRTATYFFRVNNFLAEFHHSFFESGLQTAKFQNQLWLNSMRAAKCECLKLYP